jgi:hypothetical protein
MLPTSATIPWGNVALNRELPKVCIVCGAASKGKPLSRTFRNLHPAVLFGAPFVVISSVITFVTILTLLGLSPSASYLGIMACGAVFKAMTTEARITIPVCERHRWTWRWRSIVLVLAFLPCLIGGFVVGGEGAQAAARAAKLPDNPDSGLSAMQASVAGAFAGAIAGYYAWIGLYLLLRSGAPRLRSIEPRGVTLLGIAPAFAVAVADPSDSSDT